MSEHTPRQVSLRRENGKRITVDGRSGYGSANNLERVLAIVWRKNGFPLLTLDLTTGEAEQLATALFAAIADATKKLGGGV